LINGPWGDSVEELDWSTGEILNALQHVGLDERTLVVWTSDNGAPRRNLPQGLNTPLAGWGYTRVGLGVEWWCGYTEVRPADLLDITTTICSIDSLYGIILGGKMGFTDYA